MKKALSILLMVALLASFSVFAFAADVPSAEQTEEEPANEVTVDDEVVLPDEEAVSAVDENGEEVAVTVADPAEVAEDENADEDVKAVAEQAEEATDALSAESVGDALTEASENADLDEEVASRIEAVLESGNALRQAKPFIIYSPDGNYPFTYSEVLSEDNFVAYLVWDAEAGAWVVPEGMVLEQDEDGNWVLSFVIDEPTLASKTLEVDEAEAK